MCSVCTSTYRIKIFGLCRILYRNSLTTVSLIRLRSYRDIFVRVRIVCSQPAIIPEASISCLIFPANYQHLHSHPQRTVCYDRGHQVLTGRGLAAEAARRSGSGGAEPPGQALRRARLQGRQEGAREGGQQMVRWRATAPGNGHSSGQVPAPDCGARGAAFSTELVLPREGEQHYTSSSHLGLIQMPDPPRGQWYSIRPDILWQAHVDHPATRIGLMSLHIDQITQGIYNGMAASLDTQRRVDVHLPKLHTQRCSITDPPALSKPEAWTLVTAVPGNSSGYVQKCAATGAAALPDSLLQGLTTVGRPS